MESNDIERILDKAASSMTTFGVNNACISGGEWFIILCPEHARTAFNQGWSREDISGYLFEKARMPAGEFRKQFDLLAWADWMQSLPDESMVPMTQDVENIRVIVTTSLETTIGRMACLHLAAANEISEPCGLSTGALLNEDTKAPIIENGMMQLSKIPGMGMEL